MAVQVSSFLSPLDPTLGGLGVSNNAASTVTISGAFGLTLTLSGTTSITLPTSGTLGTVSSIATTSPISGGTITTTGTLSLLVNVDFAFTAAQSITLTNATTAAADKLFDLIHTSSGTPAANFGSTIRYGLASTTTANRDAVQLVAAWSTATDASRTSQFLIQMVTGAAAIATKFTFSGAGALTAVGNISGVNLVASGSVTVGTGNAVFFNGGIGSQLLDIADGQLAFADNAGTSVTGLNIGPNTSSFPFLKRNSAGISIKAGDDSAFTALTALTGTFNQTTNQIVLGVTNTTTISSTAPAANRIATIPALGGNDTFAFLATAQTFTATQTMTAATSSLTLGAAAGNIAILKMLGNTSGTVSLTVAAAAGTWTLTLPTTGGTANFFLQTDGSGVTTWAATAAAAVTSITPGNGLTSTLTATAPGSAITTTGTLSVASLVNAQTGTSYAIVDGDRAKLITTSNAAAQAYSIAQAGASSAFQAGWFVTIYNKSTNAAGIVTITPATSTIDGAATLVLPPGASAQIFSDGTNYQVAYKQSLPPGTILAYGAATAPSGYLLCDGTAVSRTTYAALFAIVSTTFGVGDGSTTFNLPDLRQRFPLGKAVSGTGSTLGGTGGAIDHTHTSAGHTHTFSATTSGPSATILSGGGDPDAANANHTHSVSGTSGSTTPGATGTNNAPFQAVTYIIKT